MKTLVSKVQLSLPLMHCNGSTPRLAESKSLDLWGLMYTGRTPSPSYQLWTVALTAVSCTGGVGKDVVVDSTVTLCVQCMWVTLWAAFDDRNADPDVRVDMETFLNHVVPEVREKGLLKATEGYLTHCLVGVMLTLL